MSTAIAEKIDTQAIKERIDLRELAGQHTTLKRASATELAGPCPKCGGDDRFHVAADWFMCRQCHEKRGDVIEFVRWQQGVGFREAVAMLEPGATLPAISHRRSAAPRRAEKRSAPTWNQQRAKKVLSQAQQALWASDAAMEYLSGRGLEPHTWLTFGLGYNANAMGKGPAIALPWYRAGQLSAIRYRLLEPDGKQKLVSERGSRSAGLLFGGQAGPLPGPERTLVITEGELNALSIWQVAHESRLDVLSIGSESAQLSNAMLGIAQQYGMVLVWADRAKVAKEQALKVDAHAVSSPGDKDANDLLQEGALGYALAFWRYNLAKSEQEREALLWALWDAANTLLGVDAGTAKVIGRLANELGKQAKVTEAEPGRWIAER